jgi:type I pullulanase
MINNATGNNVVIDLSTTEPDGGWAARPAMVEREDAIIYEVHVRDFSIDSTSGVTAAKKGKFMGMVETGTTYSGVKTCIDHLKELGVTHVQILPFYDFATAQYNWGYDPKNFNIPEEQYSMTPADSVNRIKEVKTMINEFHKNGIRVIMDVVYNHVYGTEVFENITERYFTHNPPTASTDKTKRWDLSGCGNSINSAEPMVSRFIQDSLNFWAQEYRMDGFRFDLIGIFHYQEANKWGVAVNNANPGANILMYGEPWNGYATDVEEGLKVRMGKVPAMAEGHVGVFNGKYREALKGDNDGTGKGYIFNTSPSWVDAIKVGMRGSITFSKSTSTLANDWDSMFAYDPEQSINYVSAHDNYDLWDKILHCGIPDGGYAKRIVKFAHGILLTSQGIPFIHAGDEFARTKVYNGDWTYAHNSYNAPDNYNKIDWSRKISYNDVFTYTRDLIKLRKSHPGFRLNSWDEVNGWMTSTSSPDGKVYTSTITSSNNGDSWSKILVIYNSGNNFAYTLPSGTWNLAVEKENGAASGSYTGSITIEGTAVTVLYQGAVTTTTSTTTTTTVAPTTTTTVTPTTTTTLPFGTGLVVHILKNSVANWSSFNCYYWASNGSPVSNAWPGAVMTSEGDGWYKYTIPGATTSNVIFNNGSVQTVDLARTGEGWFTPTGTLSGKITGTWSSTKPVTTTTTSTTTTTTVTPTTTTTVIPTTTTTTVVGNITLKMTKDVGTGNSLFFTGSIPALTSWGTGKQGTWTTGNVWQYTFANPGVAFEWKVRKGVTGSTGNAWETGTNHNNANLWPVFNGGF